MKYRFFHILLVQVLFSILFSGSVLLAQTSVNVSEPRIEIQDNIIHIYFDILNSTAEDQFNISLDVTDEDGKRIRSKSLKGDHGAGISGGPDKHIEWNLEADNIYLSAAIFFEIHAVYTPKAEPPPPVPDPEIESPFSRSSLILQSLAIPGLGLSRYTGKPHWIRGAAGYACLAGSLIFNLQAKSTYRSIEDVNGFEDKKELHDKSVTQDKVSEVMAFAALGIWVTDVVWTIVGTSDMKRLSLGGSFDPNTGTPLIYLSYRF